MNAEVFLSPVYTNTHTLSHTVSTAPVETGVCSQATVERTLIITMNPYKEAAKHLGPVITTNQLKKWASDGNKARANTLSNSHNIKGLLVVNETKKLKAIFMPHVVVDDNNNTVIIGTIERTIERCHAATASSSFFIR